MTLFVFKIKPERHSGKYGEYVIGVLANNEEEALSLALTVERHWNHTLIYEVKTNEVSEPAIVFDGGYEE